jgi:hypothetical protein
VLHARRQIRPWLLSPDFHPRGVEYFRQVNDIVYLEPAAEVACRGSNAYLFLTKKANFFRKTLDKARKIGKLGRKDKAFRAFSRVFRLLSISIRGIALFQKLPLKGGFGCVRMFFQA